MKINVLSCEYTRHQVENIPILVIANFLRTLTLSSDIPGGFILGVLICNADLHQRPSNGIRVYSPRIQMCIVLSIFGLFGLGCPRIVTLLGGDIGLDKEFSTMYVRLFSLT